MTFYEMIHKMTAGEIGGWAAVLLIILLSLIEVAPIKISPWTSILGWFGKKMTGNLQKQVDEVQKQITTMWVNAHRQSILTFARELRYGVKHSSDEWTNVLNQAEDYERFVHDRKITNGIITQDTEYIRSVYQEMSREHKI